MKWKMPLFKMYWDENDVESVSSVIKSGMSWAVGAEVQLFEQEIASTIGTKHALTYNSGTSALHAALLALNIGPGDEVIVPSFTFISTVNSPLFVGAKPVFADIEEKRLGLDPDSVQSMITPRTKAIIPVHYSGCPCMINELREIADDKGIFLIEDAAESFGASINGKPLGSIGDVSILSFCQNKIITTGEGGALVTNSDELYQKGKLIRSHGRSDNLDYFNSSESSDYIGLGYNFRLSNISSALGRSQLNKLDFIIQSRIDIAEKYKAQLDGLEGVQTLSPPADSKCVYQLFSLRVPDRDGLMNYLSKKGIMSKVYFPPVHKTQYYRKSLGYKPLLPITEKVSDEIISLPIYPGMNFSDISIITQTIKDYYMVS